MADRLHEAREPSEAVRKKRLVDFTTGKADLQPEHTGWLDETLRFLPAKREFWIWVYGYASKRGFHGERDSHRNEEMNTTLSFARASAVVGYLEERNPLITPRVRRFIQEEIRPTLRLVATTRPKSELWKCTYSSMRSLLSRQSYRNRHVRAVNAIANGRLQVHLDSL
jgi:hypothetical protein